MTSSPKEKNTGNEFIVGIELSGSSYATAVCDNSLEVFDSVKEAQSDLDGLPSDGWFIRAVTRHPNGDFIDSEGVNWSQVAIDQSS